MSLKIFHIVFIALSTLLCATLAFWGFEDYSLTHTRSSLVLGIVGTITLLLLIPYFQWFRRKMKRIAVVVLTMTLAATLLDPSDLWACAVCYGDPNSPLTKGIKMGILSLAGLVYLLLTGILVVVISWIRRARKPSTALRKN